MLSCVGLFLYNFLAVNRTQLCTAKVYTRTCMNLLQSSSRHETCEVLVLVQAFLQARSPSQFFEEGDLFGDSCVGNFACRTMTAVKWCLLNFEGQGTNFGAATLLQVPRGYVPGFMCKGLFPLRLRVAPRNATRSRNGNRP